MGTWYCLKCEKISYTDDNIELSDSIAMCDKCKEKQEAEAAAILKRIEEVLTDDPNIDFCAIVSRRDCTESCIMCTAFYIKHGRYMTQADLHKIQEEGLEDE